MYTICNRDQLAGFSSSVKQAQGVTTRVGDQDARSCVFLLLRFLSPNRPAQFNNEMYPNGGVILSTDPLVGLLFW